MLSQLGKGISDSPTQLNTSNPVEYQYQVYGDYLGATKRNIQNYSQNPELSIKYFKIDIPKSPNMDDTNSIKVPEFNAYGKDSEDDNNQEIFKGTGINHSYKNNTYDIYEFTPVIEIQPLTYEPAGENWIGTHSSMSIMSIERPSVGDLFTFYGAKDDITDGTEIFQISDVSYQRTSHGLLPLYTLQFRSAPLTKQSIKELNINEVFFFSNHFNKFLKSDCWESNQFALDFFNKKLAKDFDELYLKDKGKYLFKSCPMDPKNIENRTFMIPMVFNNTIKRLSSLIKTGFKPVLDFSTNVSLNEFLDGKKKVGSENLFQFCIYQEQDLYNIYAGAGYTDEENPVQAPDPIPEHTINEINDLGEEFVVVVPEAPGEWIPKEITDETIPIAFIDKDFITKDFKIIDNLGNERRTYNYQKYLKLWELTKKIKKLYYCGIVEEPIELTQYDEKGRIGKTRFFNFWKCSGSTIDGDPDILEANLINVKNSYNAHGVINDFLKRRIIIGDLGLPNVISFQYGVAYY